MECITPFSTDVFVFRPPEAEALNPPLRQALLAERQGGPGVSASEVGGWHSVPDLARRPGPPTRPVMQSIVRHTGEVVRQLAGRRGQTVPPLGWSVEAWAIILDEGGYNRPHDHHPAHFSAAWYVDAGEPPTDDHPLSGAFSVLDPRRATGVIPGLDLWPSSLDIRPESGMLIVFPAWLRHHVHPYRGERPRVVVSANLRLVPPGTP